MTDPPDKPEHDDAPRRKQRGRSLGKRQRAKRDAQGTEQPAFLRSLPDHPDANRLIAAFVQGNYAYVRREAERLADRADQPEVRDAAREIRRRLDPDPLVRYLLAAAFLLLAFLVTWAYVAH